MTMNIAIAASDNKHTALSSTRDLRADIRAKADTRASSVPLAQPDIAESFSLIDGGPITISAALGLVVRARRGSLWISQHGERRDHVVCAGQCFVTDRAGPLVISALGVAELYIEWPLHDIERLSPGLESTVAAA